MTQIKIVYDRHSYVTRRGDPNDRWARDDTDADTTIKGIEVVRDHDYFDITAPFEIDINKTYILLWAIYSTGDSFGHDGGQVEFIDLFESQTLAAQAAQEIEKQSDSYSVTYTREDGNETSFASPWHGYFERLQEVRLDVVRVTRLR